MTRHEHIESNTEHNSAANKCMNIVVLQVCNCTESNNRKYKRKFKHHYHSNNMATIGKSPNNFKFYFNQAAKQAQIVILFIIISVYKLSITSSTTTTMAIQFLPANSTGATNTNITIHSNDLHNIDNYFNASTHLTQTLNRSKPVDSDRPTNNQSAIRPNQAFDIDSIQYRRLFSVKVDDLLMWLVDGLAQFVENSLNDSAPRIVKTNQHHRIRSKRASALSPDVELVNNSIFASNRPQVVKSVNPNLNVTHMKMRDAHDDNIAVGQTSYNEEHQLPVKSKHKSAPEREQRWRTSQSGGRQARRQAVMAMPSGVADNIAEANQPSIEPATEDPYTTAVPDNRSPSTDGTSAELGTSEPSYDDVQGKRIEFPNEGAVDDIITPSSEPTVSNTRSKTNKGARRKSSSSISAELNNPSTTAYSTSTTPTTTSTAGASSRVPPPEQNPLKDLKIGDQNEFGGVNMNDEKQYIDLQDNTAPQVGDQIALDMATKKPQEQMDAAEMLKEQHRLMKLIQAFENNLAQSSKVNPQKAPKYSPMFDDYPNNPGAVQFEPADHKAINYPLRATAPYAATVTNYQSQQQQPTVQPPQVYSIRNLLADQANSVDTAPNKDPINSPNYTRLIPVGTLYPSTHTTPYKNYQQYSKQKPALVDMGSQIEDSFYDSGGGILSSPSPKFSKKLLYSQDTMKLQPITYQTGDHRMSNSKLKAAASRHYANIVAANQQSITPRPTILSSSSRYDVQLQDPQDFYSIPNSASNQATNVLGYLRAMAPQSSGATLATTGQQYLSQIQTASPPVVPQSSYRRTTAVLTTNANGTPSLLAPMGNLPPLPAYIIPAQGLPIQMGPTSGVANNKYATRTGQTPSKRQMTTSAHNRLGKSSSTNNNDDSLNPQSSSATSDPLWSETQNQEDDYQQAPQTIQITAVPNGVGWNGINAVNGLAGWNGWNGPWNGRQVLLVNRQPTVGTEWRSWALPVAAVLALPLVLGALFVPMFLKSVMFLIQILQMLGLLMPPAQLAGHLSSSTHGITSG